MNDSEKRRLQDAFRRLSASSGHISRHVFIKEVVGDALPPKLGEQIFSLCHGINSYGANGTLGGSSASKGLNFREVFSYLVLITRGTNEEKIKCKCILPGFFINE